ncbi:major capsid protein [Pyruvatibacter sp.]
MSDITNPNQLPFTHVGLTGTVNTLPPQWGRVTEMGLFDAEPISSTVVEVVRENGKLAILADEPRGTNPNVADGDDINEVMVKVPHFPWLDTITPDDIQNLFNFVGRTRTPRTLETEMAKRLMKTRRRGDITKEFLNIGSLKGKLYDGKGAELYNWFDVFGINQKKVDFKLATATTDIREKCEEVIAHQEDNIGDDVMGGTHCLVDPSFFNRLVARDDVKEFYKGHTAALQLAGREIRTGFPLHGVVFEPYRATAKGIDGETKRFIEANTGHAFPEGTTQTFAAYNAPPHDVRLANELVGEEIYISPKVLDHGAGVELKCQLNQLPICVRPEVLVEVNSSN